MTKLFLSIDPGAAGALVIMDEQCNVIDMCDMPMRYLMQRKKRERQSKYLADGKTLRKKRPPLKQDTRRVFDGATLRPWILPYVDQIEVAVIEQVSSRTAQGSKSIFKFGETFGAMKGFLEALGINYYLVQPKEWQAYFGITAKSAGTDDLKVSIHKYCKTIYPEVILEGPSGAMKDGRSDAILIGRCLVLTRKDGTLKTIGVPPWPDDQGSKDGVNLAA